MSSGAGLRSSLQSVTGLSVNDTMRFAAKASVAQRHILDDFDNESGKKSQ